MSAGEEAHRLIAHDDLLARARPRPDALDKLRADAGFLTDRLGGAPWHGAIVGSPWPHARVVSIDVSGALALPGVRVVVTAADIPGVARYGLRVVDRPVLCADVVRCVGDPVAAVAADTPAIARAAAERIAVTYEPLPPLFDAEQALQPGAAVLHPGSARGNLLHQASFERGDPVGLPSGAAITVEAQYRSPRQMHAFLETEGGVVEVGDDGALTVCFGGHHPERDRQVIAAMLCLPPARVRVIASPVGGSYGGKDELTIQPIAALLAWKGGHSVRLHLDRPQSTDLGVKRHAMTIRMNSACDAQGRLLSHRVQILADTGAYATHGPEVLDAALEHAIGPYAWQAVRVDARLAYTNNGIAGAFRGFGAVQVQFALERQIDALADRLGLDPAEMRRRNLLAPDAPGPLGQQVAPFDGVQRALDVVGSHPLWRGPRWRQDHRHRHAVGLALVHRSDGFGRGGPNGARMVLALGHDGRIEFRTGFTELGQNLLGAIATSTARAFDCDERDVRAVLGDSALTPDSGPAAASRSTTLVLRALREAVPEMQRRLCVRAAELLGRSDATCLRTAAGGIADTAGLLMDYPRLAASWDDHERPVLTIDLPPEETPSDVDAAHYVFGACAALAEVSVDTWTGAVRVQRVVIAAALGPVVSPLGFLGQMEGGALIGQGLATTERLPMREGRYLNRNLDSYLIPTLADAPAWEVIAIENLMPGDQVGPRGAGEIGVNIAVPAIANAVARAIGAPITSLPIDPDTVLDLLERQEAA